MDSKQGAGVDLLEEISDPIGPVQTNPSPKKEEGKKQGNLIDMDMDFIGLTPQGGISSPTKQAEPAGILDLDLLGGGGPRIEANVAPSRGLQVYSDANLAIEMKPTLVNF